MRLVILGGDRRCWKTLASGVPRLVASLSSNAGRFEAHQLHIQGHISLFATFLATLRYVLFSAVDDAHFNVFGIAATLIAPCQQQAVKYQSAIDVSPRDQFLFAKCCSDYIDNEAVK